MEYKKHSVCVFCYSWNIKNILKGFCYSFHLLCSLKTFTNHFCVFKYLGTANEVHDVIWFWLEKGKSFECLVFSIIWGKLKLGFKYTLEDFKISNQNFQEQKNGGDFLNLVRCFLGSLNWWSLDHKTITVMMYWPPPPLIPTAKYFLLLKV